METDVLSGHTFCPISRGRGLAVARARRGDVAVRRDLPGHGRGRPAELRGDLAGAAVAVEHPLDRVPLVPREPPVRPPGRLGSGHFGLPPSRAGGFRPLWGCLPGFATQDSAQRVALSPEAVAMKMRIKGELRTCTKMSVLLLRCLNNHYNCIISERNYRLRRYV